MIFGEGEACCIYWLFAALQIVAYRLPIDRCTALCFGKTKTTHISTSSIVDDKQKRKITVHLFHSNNAPASADSR